MSSDLDQQVIYGLTYESIVQLLDESVLAEALHLYEGGQVTDALIEDGELFALVGKGSGSPQAAEMEIEDGEIYVGCTCDHGGPNLCAHVGAMLLAWVHEPESFAGYDASLTLPADNSFRGSTEYENEYLETLGNQSINDLRDLARQRGLAVQGTRKEPIVQQLATALSDVQATRLYLAQQSKTTQDLLIYLNLTLGPGYGFTPEGIIQALQRRQSQLSRRSFYDQITALVGQGLLVTFKSGDRTYYMLPQAVRSALPSRPGLVPQYTTEQDLAIRERPATAPIQACYALWTYLVEHPCRRESASPRLSVEDSWPQLQDWNHLSRQVDDLVQRRRTPYNLYGASVTVPPPPFRLCSGDRSALRHATGQSDHESEFFCGLLEYLAAVRGDPGETVSPQERAFEALLSQPPTSQTHLLIDAWMNTLSWNEMDLLRQSTDSMSVRRSLNHASFKPRDLYREWRAGRWAVMRFLSTVDEGDWISLDGLLKVIHEILPNLIHTQSDPSVWWLESVKTKKQFGTTLEDWIDSSGRFVTAVIEGPLYWLGAARLGYKNDRLVALQLTPVGAYALAKRDSPYDATPQPPPEGAAILNDDMTVVVVPGLAPAELHALLHLLGELKETSPQRFVYRITAEGVLSALEQGQTIGRLLAAIQHWCGRPLPPAWRQKIHTWSENYGKLHIYDDISLIELADDYALQEILSSTSLREHVIHQFSPRLVAIQADAIELLIQEMEKQGYTPYVE
jgi:hypothetical protein